MQINTGDTAWVLLSAALVFIMTPGGVAFFYGGMVREKNVITTMFQILAVVVIVSLQWVLFGYSLSFGPDLKGGIIGNLDFAFMNGVGVKPDTNYAATIPAQAFSIFQMMFAIITPALVVGGMAERIKLSSFFVVILLWTTLVYDPLAHWVWSTDGWLRKLGVLDFAGGTVVHIASGVSGLVAALYLGKRAEYGSPSIKPHNVPFVLLGAILLWFGWFGFNAGSSLSANGLAASTFFTTNTAAAAGILGWILIEKIKTGHASLMGASAGAVVGLVAITPAAGYVTIIGSIFIGFIGGIVCFYASTFMKKKFGYDDALDVFGGHGIGGTWGALATGIFATVAVNSAGANGLIYGNPKQVLVQLLGIVVGWVFSGGMTYLILKVVDKVMGLRVTKEEELIGLDQVIHNEYAYPESLKEIQ